MNVPGMPTDRVTATMVLLVVTAGTMAVIAYYRLDVSRRSATDSVEQWQECRELVKQIERLRDQPRQAADAFRSASQLAQVMEATAHAVGVAPERIVRIDPRSTRRIGDTPYQEQPTRVELRELTLEQIVSFLRKVVQEERGTEVAELRLKPARTGGVDAEKSHTSGQVELWDAEVTLTALAFSP